MEVPRYDPSTEMNDEDDDQEIVIALFDFMAGKNDEALTFKKGDLIILQNPGDVSDWIQGKSKRTGRFGKFPKSYVTEFDPTHTVTMKTSHF